MWVRSLSWEDSLEMRIFTHLSILARKIPGGRGAQGLPTVGHKESDMTVQTHALIYLF